MNITNKEANEIADMLHLLRDMYKKKPNHAASVVKHIDKMRSMLLERTKLEA